MAGNKDCPDRVDIYLDGFPYDGCRKKNAVKGKNYPGSISGRVCCTYPKCPYDWK